MSGLIWAGIGQGIANAGRSMGDYMMRADLEEERQREKAELQRERLAATERENERNRQLRAEMAAASAATRTPRGGGDGGLDPKSFAEGGENELMLAQRAGMTVPELRARDRLSMTGDTEPYKQDVTRYKPEVEGADTTDAVSRRYAKEMGLTEIVKELPPGFEAEAKAKAQTLAKIKESFVFAGKYNELTKGRENQFRVDMAQGVIGGTIEAGRGAQAVGVMSGTPMVDIKDKTEFSPYIAGQRQTTEVGRAEIAKDMAQADRAKREPTGKNEDLPTLQQMRKAAEETLKDARKALTEFDKANTGDLSRPGREKLKEQRDALALEVTNARGELGKISERLGRRLDDTEAASKPTTAPKPAAAPSDSKPPDIASVQGAPAGAVIGARTDKGWEVKDKNGKLLGYIRK